MFKYYVYRHIRLDTGRPFYVGKGKGIRAWSTRTRNLYWFNIVNKHGYKVEIVKFFQIEHDANQFEIKLIKVYKSLSLCESNYAEGGMGGNTWKYLPESHKQKLRAKASERSIGSKNPMYGKNAYENKTFQEMVVIGDRIRSRLRGSIKTFTEKHKANLSK